MTDLIARAEKLLSHDPALTREQAKHEDSDGYFGFISGVQWRDERTTPLVKALIECVKPLEKLFEHHTADWDYQQGNCKCTVCHAITNLASVVEELEKVK